MEPSERIKDLREKRGLTQKQFSEALGVSQGFLGQIEIGIRKPSREFLKKLKRAFGISSDYVLYSDTGTQWEKIESILKERGLNEESVQDIKGHYVGGLHMAAHMAREKEHAEYSMVRESETPYRVITPEQKKLIFDILEILESDDEVTVNALKGNILAFLEGIRAKKKNNKDKGGA